jgi:hypothetical protein
MGRKLSVRNGTESLPEAAMDKGGQHDYKQTKLHNGIDSDGLMIGPAKGVSVKSPSRARIPRSPPFFCISFQAVVRRGRRQ